MKKSARYTAIVAISAVLAALIGGWLWVVAVGQDFALNQAKKRAEHTIARAESNFENSVRAIDLLLEMASKGLGQRNLVTLRNDPETARLFAELARRVPDVQELWIADAEGKIVYGVGTGFANADLAKSDFFLSQVQPSDQVYVGALIASGGAINSTPLSRRLVRGGRFAGIVFATAGSKWIQRVALPLDLPANSGLAILNQQGNVVASSWPQINALDAPLRQELAKRAFSKGSFGSYTVSLQSGRQDAQEMLLGYKPVKGLNLVALYAVPYVTALQAWSYQLWIGSAIIAAAVALIIGAAILLLVYGRRQGDLHRMIGLRTAEAAQAAERLALAIDTTGIGIFDYRLGNRDVAWAGVEPAYFGLHAPPELTPRAILRSVHPADRSTLLKRLRSIKSARADTRFDTEFRLRHPEFGAIWVAARAKLFLRDGKGPGRLIGTLRDITERRRLQEHREMVLREINHRIKNSLQLMNSIMNLQSRRITSIEERARFESARRRLISLATVYAHLDDTTQPDVVDLVPFLRRLCQDFSVAYMADGRVNLRFAAEGERLISATLAVPLGMAMGEILVNISLGGFAAQSAGSVAVEVSIRDEQVEIVVRHNGRSVEDAFSNDGTNLGRLLIDAFVDQLGGSFVAENANPGLVLTMRFRAPSVPTARTIGQVQPNRTPA